MIAHSWISRGTFRSLGLAAALAASAPAIAAQGAPAGALTAEPGGDLVVRARLVHTMRRAEPGAAAAFAEPIVDGAVRIEDGRIAAVGPASEVEVPEGVRVLSADVCVPGLVDAHSVVGLAGWLNQAEDQDQIDRTEPLQPELRAIDGYDPLDPLIAHLRGFGVTTVHTGHAPGPVIAGDTLIAKTRGETVASAVLRPGAMVAATLAAIHGADGKSPAPGTRPKAVALLRSELVRAKEYAAKRAENAEKPPDRDLRLEALAGVLARERPLLVTAERAQDIQTALRLAEEFGFELVLDGAAEAYLLVDELRAAGVPVILHAPMARPAGDRTNASLETAATLLAAGIRVALQSGYESYVPKTRVVLFEAALAARHGLAFQDALGLVTLGAAEILGVADRVGSLEVGKDGDLALYDGDPFEFTSHCIGVVIEGQVVSETPH